MPSCRADWGLFGLLIGDVRASGDAPVPGGHGSGLDGGVGGKSGVDDGQAGAPFEIGDEGGAEFGVGGKTLLVGGLEQELEPAFALLVGDALAEVMLDHRGVSAVVIGVFRGSTEDLADEGGDVLEVLRRHAGEERGEERIEGDLLVEALDEGAEGFGSAQPLVEGGDVVGHGWYFSAMDTVAVWEWRRMLQRSGQ